MRLARMKVTGLFGLFEHEISFNLGERITILHAPNGFGKTVMLKIIAAFFGGSSQLLREIEFTEIVFDLIDDSQIQILQDQRDPSRPFKIIYSRGTERKEFDPSLPQEDPPEERQRMAISGQAIERHVPFLRRTRPGILQDIRTGQTFSYRKAMEAFWKLLPPTLRSRRGQPDWLQELRASVHCRLIETQRLLKIRPREAEYDSDSATLIPVVRSHSAALKSLIQQRLAESATLSQTLDRTFPARLIRKQIPGFT